MDQHEAYRGDLLAHCYRMLGSFDEAEDLVQETLLRAWKAADRYDPERASVRTWLHRIATNVCLTALEGRARRPLPSGLGPAGEPGAALTPNLDIPWLQPFPGLQPDIRLAFVAALQLLPARQRSALILRDVLQFSAAEVAETLDTTVASVNSSLQRARVTVGSADLDSLREEPDARAVVDRYQAAFEAADVPALVKLLADDVVLEMPPVDLWLQGRDDYEAFMVFVFARRPEWRLVPIEANGTPALAAYAGDKPHSIQVFDVRNGQITRNVTFADPRLFRAFA